jgi:dsDNA-specific endonuclease/ATPase MutS2
MQIYNIEAINWAQEEIQENEPFTETVEEMEAYLLERMADCVVLSKQQLQEIVKEKR